MDETVADRVVTIQCAKCQNVIDITGLEPGDSITCPYCGHEFPIMLQFGNFLLERQLGAGGMGSVYFGRDVTLNRNVAVKVLRSELVNDQKFLATFLREAEITASLNHPNIVQVFAFGEQNGVYYLVMEYIQGGTLDDKIVENGSITELEGIEIGIAVARGLEFALQRGLIHRDIKPGNIVFGSHSTPKVVDFGLSRTFDTSDNFSGEIWGTPYYVAPEKLERKPEDFRSDLYSLGTSLFHALAGRPPYDAEDPNEVAMKHLSGNIVSIKAFAPHLTDQTAYAISRAIARYPEDRFESYGEFIAQLEDAKRRLTDANFQDMREQEVTIINSPSSQKQFNYLILAAIVVILILGGILAWNFSSIINPKPVVDPALNGYAPDMPAATKKSH